MRTLRELGNFVGIPQDAGDFNQPQNIGMRLVGQLLGPSSGSAERTSLLSLIHI